MNKQIENSDSNIYRPSSPTEVDGTIPAQAGSVTATGVGCNALLGSVLISSLSEEYRLIAAGWKPYGGPP